MENWQLLNYDNKFEEMATKLLVNQPNQHLTNKIHDQGDTHQCWAYALGTMLQHSRTEMNYKLNETQRFRQAGVIEIFLFLLN